MSLRDEGSSLILPPARVAESRRWQRAGAAPATRIPLLLKGPARDIPTGISSPGTHRIVLPAGGGAAVPALPQCSGRHIPAPR